MKNTSTLFLKCGIVLFGLVVVAMCVFWLPALAREDVSLHAETAYLHYPFLIGAYLVALPVLVALYQAYRLLTYIERGEVFAAPAVRSLKTIALCAATVSGLIIAGLTSVIIWTRGSGEDITGVFALAVILTFVTGVIAASAGILRALLISVVDSKTENDLTV